MACGGEGSGLGPGMPTGAQRDQPHHEPPKGQPVPLSHASQQGSCHDCCRQLPSHGALLLCLRHTQLWPESGRGQEGLAEVTYPTPVTSQDLLCLILRFPFTSPSLEAPLPCHLLGGRIREEGGAMTHPFLRERGPRTTSASSGQADEGGSKGVL